MHGRSTLFSDVDISVFCNAEDVAVDLEILEKIDEASYKNKFVELLKKL